MMKFPNKLRPRKKNKGRSELPSCRFLRDNSKNMELQLHIFTPKGQLPGTFHNVKTLIKRRKSREESQRMSVSVFAIISSKFEVLDIDKLHFQVPIAIGGIRP